MRTWTDNTGEHQVEAEFLSFQEGPTFLEGKLWLRREDGQNFGSPITDFSKPDEQYVRRLVEEAAAAIPVAEPGPDSIVYGLGHQLCDLKNKDIRESSGMASSRRAPGMFWTHNDSGANPRVYLFDRQGTDLGSCSVGKVRAYDWEDMASFGMDGKDYLLLCDVGNNGLGADVHMLHLIEEPPIDPKRGVEDQVCPIVETIYFGYEGNVYNCEAVSVDPTSKTILFVTKERSSTECHVFALPWPESNSNTAHVARRIATLTLPAVTSLDISPDGRRAVVLTYAHAYEYTRGEEEDWSAGFSRDPRRIPMPWRPQGEAICYGPDGKTLYLTSEKLPTPLLEVPLVSE